MSPKPADRPSAREVLQSDLLPPVVEDEQLKDLVRSLPNNPATYERVVDAIFQTAALAAPAAGASADLDGSGGGDGGGAAGAGAGGGGGGSALGPLALGELPGVPINVHVEVRDAVTRVVHDVFRCGGGARRRGGALAAADSSCGWWPFAPPLAHAARSAAPPTLPPNRAHGAVPVASSVVGIAHGGLARDAVRLLAPSGAQIRCAAVAAAAAVQGRARAGAHNRALACPVPACLALGIFVPLSHTICRPRPPSPRPCSLRYESRYPFAVWLAQQAALAGGGGGGGLGGAAAGAAPEGVRRYEVSHVMRAGRVRGLPATYLQVGGPSWRLGVSRPPGRARRAAHARRTRPGASALLSSPSRGATKPLTLVLSSLHPAHSPSP
jgi:hypothetical protein